MNKKKIDADRKAYLQPNLRVVEIDSSEILAGSTPTETYSVGSNGWTNNDGEDEDFFNN